MINKKKVAFYTLGCKLNFAETSTIARSFEEDGYTRVDFEDPADIYVINTCSVTENADKQFKQIVRKALKTNPKAFLAAVGCYAQLKPEELASVDGVDLVLGAKEKFNITLITIVRLELDIDTVGNPLNREVMYEPDDNLELQTGDKLFVFGSIEKIAEFRNV